MTTKHKTWRFAAVNWRLKASCTIILALYAALLVGEELFYLAAWMSRGAWRVVRNIAMCPVAVALLVVMVCAATAMDWRASWSR